MRHELFPADELRPSEMRQVNVDGMGVVVIRMPNGQFGALRDVCAHRGARLSDGQVQRLVVGNEVGQYELTDDYVVRCPWHGYEYELSSGRCPADPDRIRVRAFKVCVENGTVVLES